MRKEKDFKYLKDIFLAYKGGKFEDDELIFLFEVVDYFRPRNHKNRVSIGELINYFVVNVEDREIFFKYIKRVFEGRHFGRMISEEGISYTGDFFYELKKRISYKILPSQPNKDTLEYVLNQVFYSKDDIYWVERIERGEIKRLFEVLEIGNVFNSDSVRRGVVSEIFTGVMLLSQRITGKCVDPRILEMIPEYSELESPFLELEKEIMELRDEFLQGKILYIDSENEIYRQIEILYRQCEKVIDRAYGNSSKYGITLKVNQILMCLRDETRRVMELLRLLVFGKDKEFEDKTIEIFVKLLEFNCYKNNVSTFLKESVRLVSYEVTQHTALTGEKYITKSKKEYLNMFKTAVGGGFIVGFMCIFKLLLGKVHTSDFGHAFYYSMNYSVGFILIYLLHFTLATKQPAMTATTIIRSIEGAKDNNYKEFSELFARLFRSQFIAFMGNIIMAFPISMLILWICDMVFGINLAEGKWETFMDDANMFKTPVIFHASIAGVFLFFSGIISGSVANSNRHNKLYYRLKENPRMKGIFGRERAERISRWIEKNMPGISSNFWFGIFMGSIWSVGDFFGIDLNIRHITFVSGNLGMGLYGSGFEMPVGMFLYGVLGMVLVGIFNFVVSFGLSLGVAMSSRDKSFKDLGCLSRAVWEYFKSNKLEFFVPKKVK